MWTPDGTGRDRQQPPDLPDAFPMERGENPYPWIVVDGKVVKMEVRCAVCHAGLCGRSMAVNLPQYGIPCVFVPVCRKCIDDVRKDPKYQPNDHLDYPEIASSRAGEAG